MMNPKEAAIAVNNVDEYIAQLEGTVKALQEELRLADKELIGLYWERNQQDQLLIDTHDLSTNGEVCLDCGASKVQLLSICLGEKHPDL